MNTEFWRKGGRNAVFFGEKEFAGQFGPLFCPCIMPIIHMGIMENE
jgi:hypothetical protein